jgi:predicted acylesterase/phospholipase RssA
MGTEKTALVLSAGGMFGAYQAGVYSAIRARIQPDLIVGASVGAMNAWLIASGCAPDELIQRWLDPATGRALSFLDPAPLRAQAEQICRQYTPRTPLGVVVVQLAGLRPRLVQYPDIGPEHLHASCSIPLFLPIVRIEGRRYLDGGLLEKLPLWAALEMGATRIVAVDSLPKMGEWWLRLGINTVRLFKPRRHFPKDLDLTVISPSKPMGTAREAVFWKRANIERWIEMGMRDASARQLERYKLETT